MCEILQDQKSRKSRFITRKWGTYHAHLLTFSRTGFSQVMQKQAKGHPSQKDIMYLSTICNEYNYIYCNIYIGGYMYGLTTFVCNRWHCLLSTNIL